MRRERRTRPMSRDNEYAQRRYFATGVDRPDVRRMIASVGVLHHLAHPTAGLDTLLSLLRPGGLMKLGLYSQSARRDVVAAREFIAERGYASDAMSIRRSRQDLIRKFRAQSGRLTEMRISYVTSECRDSLFHVREHRFMLPQIRSCSELRLALHRISAGAPCPPQVSSALPGRQIGDQSGPTE